MLKVIIVEDQIDIREKLVTKITNYLIFEEIDAQVVLATDKPEEVISYVEVNPKDKYLFLLDIELIKDEYSGIELAEVLRRKLPFEVIIFLTSHSELSLIVLEHRISPLDYIVKSGDFESIMNSVRQDINRTMELLGVEDVVNKNYFTYVKRGRHYRILIEDIYYFEAVKDDSHLVMLHAKGRQVSLRENLIGLEERLADKGFYRCHKGYLANLSNIVTFSKRERLIYYDEEKTLVCPVAARKLRSVADRL